MARHSPPLSTEATRALKSLRPSRTLLPILIGLGVTAYLFSTQYTLADLAMLRNADLGGVWLSVLVLVVRDAAYIVRIRFLTGRELSWTSCVYVIFLWEFASATTPSAVGGTAVAVFILMKEGLTFGKALAYALLTAILDNGFFLVAAAVALLTYPTEIFPQFQFGINQSFRYLFFVSYGLIATYTFVMAFGLFARPRVIKWLLLKVTSWRWLRRWRRAAYDQGNEIMLASRELRGKAAAYWLMAVLATIFVWSARYLMLNALVGAFTTVSWTDHVLIFFRQVVMWVIMLISITPGAAGLAEVVFGAFFDRFLGTLSTVVAIFWRMFTYYPYLLIGALILPRWIRRVFFRPITPRPNRADQPS